MVFKPIHIYTKKLYWWSYDAIEEIENNIPSGNVYKYWTKSYTFQDVDHNFPPQDIKLPGIPKCLIITDDGTDYQDFLIEQWLMFKLPNGISNKSSLFFSFEEINSTTIRLMNGEAGIDGKITVNIFVWYN